MITLIGFELLAAVLGGLIFIALYGTWAPWELSAMGRYIMATALATVAKDASLLLLISGAGPPLWVFAVVYGGINWVVWWRLWILIKEQRGEHRVAAWVYGALRTGAQALWGILVAQAANLGITLPAWAQSWFVETVIVAGGIALVTAAIRWLETRKGDSGGARLARTVAKWIMFGLSGKQPVYAAPVDGAKPTTVIFDNTQTSSALKE